MNILFAILLFVGLAAIYDAIHNVNKNLTAQNEELRKIREHLEKSSNGETTSK